MSQAITDLRTKSGRPLHPIGIGTWTMGVYPLHSPGTDNEMRALRHALGLGQNHIDTAEMYARGGAERVVSKAIEVMTRGDIFLASKLWKDHVAAGTVRPAVEAMLRRLGTDYLDMLYIHAPWFDVPWTEAIPQIDELIDEGVVRHFGVSNFNAAHLQTALRLSRHPVAANQMHYSCAHRQEVPAELRQLCDDHGVALVAYQPLEQGELLKHPVVCEVAERHHATPAQIALAWLLARRALPIPKALAQTHIEQNAAAGTLTLSAEDLRRLDNLQSE